jgi:hypothetical protein
MCAIAREGRHESGQVLHAPLKSDMRGIRNLTSIPARHTQAAGVGSGISLTIKMGTTSNEKLRMNRRLLFTGLLLAALAAAEPLTITLPGTSGGSGDPFDSGATRFPPGGAPLTFWIDGAGTESLMGDQVAFGNPSPDDLNVGIWHYDMPDRLDSNSANYELSSVASALSDPFASPLGRLYLSSANGVAYSTAVDSGTGAGAPAPRRFALWVAVIAGLCVFGLRRNGIINRLASKLSQ